MRDLANPALPELSSCHGPERPALSDRPEVTQAQRIHRHAVERGRDPHAIGLPIAMRVFLKLVVTGQVPGVLDRPRSRS